MSLHRIDNPQDDGKGTDRRVESANAGTLPAGAAAAVVDKVPHDNQEAHDADGVPAPLLR